MHIRQQKENLAGFRSQGAQKSRKNKKRRIACLGAEELQKSHSLGVKKKDIASRVEEKEVAIRQLSVLQSGAQK